jgi:hypothetical protein
VTENDQTFTRSKYAPCCGYGKKKKDG